MQLSEVLTTHRAEIVRLFVDEVQAQDVAPGVRGRGLLTDHIPTFLTEVARELQRLGAVDNSQDASDHSESAKEHGQQRFAIGYDLDSVVREYGILRHSILTIARPLVKQVSIDEFDVLAKCLNIGVAEAVSSFVAARQTELAAEKANLEYLAEAGRSLASSLDFRSILTRITALLVPQLADWCVVFLEGFKTIDEVPMAHVDPGQIEALRAHYRDIPLPEQTPFGYQRVLTSGRSELVLDPDDARNASGDPEVNARVAAIGITPWMCVPLSSQGHTFGAIVLGKLRAEKPNATAALLLAEELAGRAALAIENARLYELAQHQRSRVEAAIRAKDEFVAVISHELRTPLNSILGWTRMLRGRGLSEAKRAHALEVIERNANAQTQLVADLLDISRIITGKVRINPSQVDLSNLVEMTVESLRPAAEAKHIDVLMQLERQQSVIRADGDRLQQVIWNLLSNAVKFTPKRGRIDVQLRREHSNVLLRVKDSGSGIAADFLPHVFEHFRQADGGTVRNHGGLGLGLSIAKHLVELHGGTITAHSDGDGQGAEFRVALPIGSLISNAIGVQRFPAVAVEAPLALIPDGLKDLKVLVVDDAPDSRELLAEILSICEMQVATAKSAEEALRLLETFHPDIVVSDIGMPDADGYSLIRSIRSRPDSAHSSIPAIALTAYARNEDRMHALSEGFNEHLTKPVEPDRLLRAIAELVGRSPGAPLARLPPPAD